MNKIIKSFTFWFILIGLFEIFMHQIGQDSKSIVLIQLNPILYKIYRSHSLFWFMDSGMKISCRTVSESISIYWYIACMISFLIYGTILDFARLILSRINHTSK